MSRLLAYLGRFASMVLGFFCASLAASAFLHVVILGGLGRTAGEAAFVMTGPALVSVPFAALFVGYFAFVPALPVMLAAEVLGKRDWLFHALCGGGVALAIAAFHAVAAHEDARSATALMAAVFAGAGLVGGIAYWAVAGRNAGRWLHGPDRVTARTPSGS